MDIREALRRAVGGFDRRIEAMSAAQWHGPTPCSEWDVHALVNHVVYELRWIPPLLAGSTVDEVGDRFEGDLLGDDPRGAWKAAARDALDAAGRGGVLTQPVQLSSGERSGEDYLTEVTTDVTVHTWDLARAVGADERLDPELVEVAYAMLEPQVEEWRAGGAFGAAVTVPAGADRQTQLLALVGRQA
ncbi:MAG TPA: TIGR03086 family metal-binding protein [Egibacteraceae bacterium]|nr:TIGR03086 family metal-binding protein [Actinomycetota bacterium]HWB71947.1 TIGR03086 family metal-binding protein [Egibacteraceae bacterium]